MHAKFSSCPLACHPCSLLATCSHAQFRLTFGSVHTEDNQSKYMSNTNHAPPPPKWRRQQHVMPASQGSRGPLWMVMMTCPRPLRVPPALCPVTCLLPCHVPPPPPLCATAAIKRHRRAFADCEPTEQSVKMQQYSHPWIENDAELSISVINKAGNWGNKFQRDARWVQRGKLVAWTPSRDDWEVCTSLLPQYYCCVTCVQIEERAHKHIKSMLPS